MLRRLLLALPLFVLPPLTMAAGDVLHVDVRNRPPDMVVEGTQASGPLVEVISRAARRVGARVECIPRRFESSIDLLTRRKGNIDVVPRVVRTKEREALFDFLGPVGQQVSEIGFIVRPGEEGRIRRFEDMAGLKVGAHAKTVYFDHFESGQGLTRVDAPDDDSLVRMFFARRFDVMIVRDRPALEAALARLGRTDWAWAEYRQRSPFPVYYAITRDHPRRAALQKALDDMVASGEIAQIYKRHGVELLPPR